MGLCVGLQCLLQQLAQGFASGKPADVFYVSADQFQTYAANGSLYPYGSELENADDFYPSLVEQFSYDDELVCAPKDFDSPSTATSTPIRTSASIVRQVSTAARIRLRHSPPRGLPAHRGSPERVASHM